MYYQEEMSRPDNKWLSSSSTFGCDGDEGETEGEGGTLGSFTHPLMSGSLASTCTCRGDGTYSMCLSVTTSISALADGHLYGEQLRLFSIAAEEGCCRGEDALPCVLAHSLWMCGPVTTSPWCASGLHGKRGININSYKVTYDTSFLCLKQLMAHGDVESNPGPKRVKMDFFNYISKNFHLFF